ncbi:hypothetical protein AAFF_G00127380 [Aldrovandia affinis]|uniref:Uncharacterized protein n=1 Tax=Aldrovandia affinis TaxID=143900 RepID=A0AAD7T262_9TELE|nr:hypothetical protein AAFF_G00127380 [Aldrovandia affinis]
MEPSTVIDASIIGESFAGRKSSSVFPRFSFRWWVDIHAEMSARHAEIRAGIWVSDGGKVKEEEDGAKGLGLSDVKSLSDRKESSLCGVACSEPRLVGIKQVVL